MSPAPDKGVGLHFGCLWCAVVRVVVRVVNWNSAQDYLGLSKTRVSISEGMKRINRCQALLCQAAKSDCFQISGGDCMCVCVLALRGRGGWGSPQWRPQLTAPQQQVTSISCRDRRVCKTALSAGELMSNIQLGQNRYLWKEKVQIWFWYDLYGAKQVLCQNRIRHKQSFILAKKYLLLVHMKHPSFCSPLISISFHKC